MAGAKVEQERERLAALYAAQYPRRRGVYP
jgi:hypothetical protein